FKIDVYSACYEETESDKLQRFVEFVNETMRRYFILEFRKRKMYLEVPIVDEHLENLVDRWIKIAVLNQIEELEICSYGEIDCMLPEFLFCAKSLKVLKCRNIELPYYEIMELVSLTHLTLEPMFVDEDMLQRIISSCPLVELDITHGYLNEVSFPWTRKVDGRVGRCGSGTPGSNLEASPLQKFVFCSLGVNLPWPWNVNVTALKNLKTVEISYADDLELIEVTLDTPNLLEFSYNCKVETSLSIIRVSDRCNAQFSPFMFNVITTDWFIELKQFLIDTKLFKSLEMDLCHAHQIEVEEDQLSNVNTGPPYKLSELKLLETRDWSSIESSLVTFLDGLFWCCHPDVLSITTILQNSAAKLIMSILGKKVECWKDPLKSIEVEGIESSRLLSYSSKLEIRLRLSW
ncbi:hypothetical protein KSS87_000949, partial [Heliosperma pusillum]